MHSTRYNETRGTKKPLKQIKKSHMSWARVMPLTSTGEPGGIESASYPTKYQYGHYLNKSRLIQEHTANQIHTYIHTYRPLKTHKRHQWFDGRANKKTRSLYWKRTKDISDSMEGRTKKNAAFSTWCARAHGTYSTGIFFTNRANPRLQGTSCGLLEQLGKSATSYCIAVCKR